MARANISESTVLLMADDDPADCLLTEKALRKAQITCPLYVVHDGAELLDYLKREGDYADPAAAPRPSLILLDLNMPKVNGHRGAGAAARGAGTLPHPRCDPDDLGRGTGYRDELRARRERLYGQAVGLRRHGLGSPDREGALAGDSPPAALSGLPSSIGPVPLRVRRGVRESSRSRISLAVGCRCRAAVVDEPCRLHPPGRIDRARWRPLRWRPPPRP